MSDAMNDVSSFHFMSGQSQSPGQISGGFGFGKKKNKFNILICLKEQELQDVTWNDEKIKYIKINNNTIQIELICDYLEEGVIKIT